MSLLLLVRVQLLQHGISVDVGFFKSLSGEHLIDTACVFSPRHKRHEQCSVCSSFDIFPIDVSKKRVASDVFSVVFLISNFIEPTETLLVVSVEQLSQERTSLGREITLHWYWLLN